MEVKELVTAYKVVRRVPGLEHTYRSKTLPHSRSPQPGSPNSGRKLKYRLHEETRSGAPGIYCYAVRPTLPKDQYHERSLLEVEIPAGAKIRFGRVRSRQVTVNATRVIPRRVLLGIL